RCLGAVVPGDHLVRAAGVGALVDDDRLVAAVDLDGFGHRADVSLAGVAGEEGEVVEGDVADGEVVLGHCGSFRWRRAVLASSSSENVAAPSFLRKWGMLFATIPTRVVGATTQSRSCSSWSTYPAASSASRVGNTSECWSVSRSMRWSCFPPKL